MGIVLVNGKEVEIGDKERLNGIQIAARAGVEIPHYCWHPGLSVVASCRMCLVETGAKNPKTGQWEMLPKLVPACQTPAKDGVAFVTESDKVKQSRAFVEEGLLIDHPIDCPICDKAGECHLQDYHFEHGQKERRADIRPFTSRRREMGDTVSLFVDRCVMCTRCVRFTREISGTSELMVTHRGSHEEIDVFPGFPLANKLAGNVVDLCPVGALGDNDFLYSQRVWFMKKHVGVCAGCSTGCSIWVEENQDHVYRLRPRENPSVNQWWMCDEGRYGYHHAHSELRIVEPSRGAREEPLEENGVASISDLDWTTLPALLRGRFAGVKGRLSAVLSPHLTVEEAYLLARFIRELDPGAILALGPIPRKGTDERFPSGFTIHAEKCPNRLGVEAILWHFMGSALSFEDYLTAVENGEIQAAWISGGYLTNWNDDATVERLANLELLVTQDLFASPLSAAANYHLPGAAFVERSGSYVNVGHRLQSFKWAIRPPVGTWTEGQLLWRLLGRAGLYDPRQALAELAEEISYFALAIGEIPDVGVDLRLHHFVAMGPGAAMGGPVG